MSIAFFLIVFAQALLGIFGAEFVAASTDLKILVLGQLVDAICACVSYLMVMTGHQNKSFIVFGCSALIKLVSNAITIPMFGTLGAALTTSLTMVLWNIWLSVLVVRNVGVYPSIFYQLRCQPENGGI